MRGYVNLRYNTRLHFFVFFFEVTSGRFLKLFPELERTTKRSYFSVNTIIISTKHDTNRWKTDMLDLFPAALSKHQSSTRNILAMGTGASCFRGNNGKAGGKNTLFCVQNVRFWFPILFLFSGPFNSSRAFSRLH